MLLGSGKICTEQAPEEIIFPMTTVDTIGSVNELSEEIIVEWTIPKFSTLSRKVNDRYHSPEFTFLDHCFCLRIYCNGESTNESEGFTGFYLMGIDIATRCTIHFSFCLKSERGTLEYRQDATGKFEKNKGTGFPKFCSYSEFEVRKNQLLPKDVLTLRCSLMDRSLHKASVFDRLLNLSRSMTEILKGKHRADVVLKVGDQEIQAHKVILEARSEVFQKMLSHDMLENRTGEIKIDDMEAEVVQDVLGYMYGGLAKVTSENARPLYVAADMFNLQELKTLCLAFMKENISDDLFCDAFMVAEMFNETDLMQVVKDYLREHSESIIKTEKWKKLAAEDPAYSLQILTTFVEINADKNKSK